MTNPASFIFEGVSVEFSALQFGLEGLVDLTQTGATTVEVARTAQGLLTFIATTQANPFHDQRILQRELSRLAQDPKIASIFMQALHLIPPDNWHPTTKRFAEHVDLSFLAKRDDPAQVSAGAGRAETKPHVNAAPAKTEKPHTKILTASPPSARASLWGRLTNALGHLIGRSVEERKTSEIILSHAQVAEIVTSPTAITPEKDAWIVPSFEDRVRGSIVGVAVGDAMGFMVEGLPLTDIRKQHGPLGIVDFLEIPGLRRGAVSDDTQMTAAFAEGLLETHGGVGWVDAVARRFLLWSQSPDRRGAGETCLDACDRLKRGETWESSGTLASKGPGAPMRVGPVGIVYHRHPHLLDEVASASAVITHSHPTAQAASIVVARAVGLALDSSNPSAFKTAVVDFVLKDLPVNANEMVGKLRQMEQMIHDEPDEVLRTLGGRSAEEVVAGALYCVLSTDTFQAAVLRAVNIDGDSDTVGSITGSIAGALYGRSAIPEKWQRDVEGGPELMDLANRLDRLSVEITKTTMGQTITHDPLWHRFPEIRRALYDPQNSLTFFTFQSAMPSSWGPPVPLDNESLRLHRKLLEETGLPLPARMALGLLYSFLAESEVHREYALFLSYWRRHGDALFTPEFLREFADALYENYSRWRNGILTQEWAEKEINSVNPSLLPPLSLLKTTELEQMPETWHRDYVKFIRGFVQMAEPYFRLFRMIESESGWKQPPASLPLIEFYLVGHAKFFAEKKRHRQ